MAKITKKMTVMTEGAFPDVTFETGAVALVIRQGKDSIVINRDELDVFIEGLRKA